MKISNKDIDKLSENFGISYSVENSGMAGKKIVEEQLVQDGDVRLSPNAGTLELRLRAHGPDTKGNSMRIVIPLDGLRLVLNEMDRRKLEQSLESRLTKVS